MEEILILVFQVLLELFINVPWDMVWYGNSNTPNPSRPVSLGILSFFIGAGLAGLSLLFFPDVIAKRSALRIFLLFFTPVFSGTTGYWLARYRSLRLPHVVPSQHFWWSFFFSLGYVFIRFTYASRH